jgi:hypothetical protein
MFNRIHCSGRIHHSFDQFINKIGWEFHCLHFKSNKFQLIFIKFNSFFSKIDQIKNNNFLISTDFLNLPVSGAVARGRHGLPNDMGRRRAALDVRSANRGGL